MRRKILPRYLALLGIASFIAIGLVALLAISLAVPAVAEPLQSFAPGPTATLRVVMRLPTRNVPKLTEEERNKAIAIAASDSRVQRLLAGRKYTVPSVDVWLTKGLKQIGAGMLFLFAEPATFELMDWIALEYDETEATSPPYRQTIRRFTVRNTQGLIVQVDLHSSTVIAIVPAGGEFFLPDGTRPTPPARFQ